MAAANAIALSSVPLQAFDPRKEKGQNKSTLCYKTHCPLYCSGCTYCKDQTKQEKLTPVLRTGLNVTETSLLYYYYYYYYFIKLVLTCLFSYHYFIFY